MVFPQLIDTLFLWTDFLLQRTMQKYLLSFVLTGNPNTLWPNDKIYWPKYGNATNTINFNTTMSITFDDLANDKSLFWNKALWY